MQLIDPEFHEAKYQALWLTKIGTRLDDGLRVEYSDGTSRDNQAAAAIHSQNRWRRPSVSAGLFREPKATVAGAESP